LPPSRQNPMLAVKSLPRVPTATIDGNFKGRGSWLIFSA